MLHNHHDEVDFDDLFSAYHEYSRQSDTQRKDGNQQQSGKPKIRLLRGAELLTPHPVTWLVRGIMEAGVLAGAFGAPASGKTFAVLDMALCIASGSPWHGHTVDAGSVVYVAGEGVAGLRRRLAAWLQTNPDHKSAISNNFWLAERACHLPDELGDVLDMLSLVESSPKLLILDTLQRTMSGDENSTKDMSAYVRALDSIKAAYPGLTVLIVHHTGHGSPDRARGSSVLRASLDAEMSVAKDGGVISIACTKSKDSEPFAPLSFRLDSVRLDGWAGDDGQPVTSAVLVHLADHQQVEGWRAKVSGRNQVKAMIVLETLYQAQRRNLSENDHDPSGARVKLSDWVDDCIAQGITRKASQFNGEVVDKLTEKGVIKLQSPYVVMVGAE